MARITRISFVQFTPDDADVWAVPVADILAKPANDRDSYFIGMVEGVRHAEGWTTYRDILRYFDTDSYAGLPFIGFQANLSSVGLEKPIFSPTVNSYFGFYQSPSEAQEKLKLSILYTLNELLDRGEYEWLENAINLKYEMENL